ncbi:type II toxin-antitoxin system PemK/MazF family toxin [Planktothrix pseudagardhii]|uniref:mRNA interferase n=1 Tax=Planktothrix pseudagardhii TaxID=132604 RepID=A0A9W4CGC0_9CYAN|nr:type II toxin-antitoxin system PemK/MazF family toxin [Planktothrix pseudagardhii]CAD5926886.1 Endoribonuclease EndoA [Planktothrix pseudagardhii]
MATGIEIKRGMIIDVNLDPTKGSETGKIRPCIVVTNNTYNERVPVIQVVPITGWNSKKAKIKTNVEIDTSEMNKLTKKSIADCLQTRPIDYRSRLVSIRGELEPELMLKIDQALRIVFAL